MLYGKGTATYCGLLPEELGGGCVVRVPGIGREKLTAKTNKKKKKLMQCVQFNELYIHYKMTIDI